MTRPQEYALDDLSVSAPGGRLLPSPRISNGSERDASNQMPFSDRNPENVESQSAHPYDPSIADLLSNSNQQHSLNGHAFTNGWGWEIAAWLLAAVSLAALLIVLAVFADKSLHQWHSNITPGAVVAILSQFGQTAILAPVTACICQSMWIWLGQDRPATAPAKQLVKYPRLINMQEYDDGGRGPLGSLLLVGKHPKSTLVWLGMINTFLIIIFGTFAQQTLELDTRQYNLTDPAFVPRSLQYRAGQPAVQTILSGTQSPFTYNSVPDLMSLAVTDGLLRKNISHSDVAGSCPTGNCTWEKYHSMGICSSSVDVSSTIIPKCPKRSTQHNPAGCNYSVPAIEKDPTPIETNLETSKLGQTLWIGASNTPNYQYPGINTLVQFYVIYVPNLTEWSTDGFNYTKNHKDQLVALQSTLSLCLYTYNTSMTYGVTKTIAVSKETHLDWQTGEAFEDDKKTSFPTVNTTYDSELFWMSHLNLKSFSDFLSIQTFTGSASMRSATPSGGGNTTENDNVRVIAESIYDNDAGIQGLSGLLDNLAVSMTNGLRTISDLPATASGTSSSSEVYIQITWAWMIVPIAAVVLSLVFLLLTIYLSRRRNIPAWKSSLLAVLLSLSIEIRNDIGGIEQLSSMEDQAKSRNIRLEANGGQWQIVEAELRR